MGRIIIILIITRKKNLCQFAEMSVGGEAQGGARLSPEPPAAGREGRADACGGDVAPAEPGRGAASAGPNLEPLDVAPHATLSSFLTDGRGRPIKRPSEDALRRIDALMNPPRLAGIQPAGVESIFEGLEFAVVDRPGEEDDGQGEGTVRTVVLRRIPQDPLVRMRSTQRRTEG